jgi:hypothetical protein
MFKHSPIEHWSRKKNAHRDTMILLLGCHVSSQDCRAFYRT